MVDAAGVVVSLVGVCAWREKKGGSSAAAHTKRTHTLPAHSHHPNTTQIGVVSDFDLLPLDVSLDDAPNSTFPAPGAEWAPFLAVKEAAAKASATRVADVMTAQPVVVKGNESLGAAARTLLAKRVRRLPVVDDGGRLIGLFSRSDLLKTAWAGRHGGGV